MGKTIALKSTGGGGLVSLANKEGALIKKALLCRTGSFDGMFGPVEVTRELLEKVAARYNEQRANPQNDNDYAPIQVDHNRSAELTKGRILAPLEVEAWVDPETLVEEFGLYGQLRVDDEDAKAKVESGQYAHLSISFDEDDFELYEVSFVAVEAARRSIVLSHGGNPMNLEVQLANEKKNRQSLAKAIKASRVVGKAACLALRSNLEASEKETSDVAKAVTELSTKLRESSLKAQFKGFVREGRLSKAEFDALKFSDFVGLQTTALSMITASYAARPVSKDIIQLGQSGAQPVSMLPKSAEQMRKAIKLQKSGKGAALAQEDEEDKEKELAEGEDEKASDDKAADKKEEASASYADVEEGLKALEVLGGSFDKILANYKAMKAELEKLSAEQDKKEDDSSDAA